MRLSVISIFLSASVVALACAGCGVPASPGPSFLVPPGLGGDDAGEGPDDVTPDGTPDGGAPEATDMSANGGITAGGAARVTTDWLNLRTAAGTTNPVVTTMPCGAKVDVLGGPEMGWWNVRYNAATGWASGKYLVADRDYDAAVCGASPDMGAGPRDGGVPGEVRDIFDRARVGVGYSYWWGHGAWRADGQERGTCTGSCPQCSHTGRYGADCSGYVAKVWQIPGASALEKDLHPYSTYNFFNQEIHWRKIPRGQVAPGDSMVYNANGAGHMVLVESATDPWGSLWLMEARGCSYGIVRNLRSLSNSFIAIRRSGL